ncbi:MAG: hypothetical protein WD426_06730 [Anditalea sp.]
MLKYLQFLVVLLLSAHAYGQENQKVNNIILEVGGSSRPYTIGYERVVSRGTSNELRVKFGFGLIKTLECGACGLNSQITRERKMEEIISVELLNLKGEKKGRLEYGIGMGFTNAYEFTHTFLLSGRLGYRFLSLDSGFNFGVGFNPAIRLSDSAMGNKFVLYPGIKVGYGF